MNATSPEEIARRGWTLYETEIRPAVEPRHNGRFLIVDVKSGRYVLADDELNALDRAREHMPDGTLHLIRVGARAAHRLGRLRLG
jgi:hypothetical protein